MSSTFSDPPSPKKSLLTEMSTSLSPSTRPVKRLRFGRASNLLHLPDNVLLSILQYLCGPCNPPCRQLRDISHAYSFAATCTHLYTLFRTTFHEIDARPSTDIFPRAYCMPESCIRMITHGANAMADLRVLRLPALDVRGPDACHLQQSYLNVAKARVEQLRELHINYRIYLEPEIPGRQIFGSRLRILNVRSPSSSLLADLTASPCALKELVLSELERRHVTAVTKYLSQKGDTLETLRLKFKENDLLLAMAAVGDPFEKVLQHLRALVMKKASVIRTLEIGTNLMNCSLFHSKHVAEIVPYLERVITSFRKANHENKGRGSLRNIRICTSARRIPKYLKEIGAMLTEDVEVDLEYEGAHFVIPKEGKAVLKLLRVDAHVAYYQEMFGDCLKGIEKVELVMEMKDPRNGQFAKMCCFNFSTRVNVINFVSAVAPKELVANFDNLAERSRPNMAASFLADIMDAVPTIECLTVSCEVIAYFDNDDHALIALLTACSKLRALNLNMPRQFRARTHVVAREFLVRFPDFVGLLLKSDYKLECLRLYPFRNYGHFEHGKRPSKDSVKIALLALDELHNMRPDIDTSTVRGQFEEMLLSHYVTGATAAALEQYDAELVEEIVDNVDQVGIETAIVEELLELVNEQKKHGEKGQAVFAEQAAVNGQGVS